MSKINKIEKYINLYDTYSNLLTKVQKDVFEMYYFEDMSLSEIAKKRGTSRAAVQDNIKKTEKILIDFENKLKIVNKNKKQVKLISMLEKTKLTKSQKEILEKIKEN